MRTRHSRLAISTVLTVLVSGLMLFPFLTLHAQSQFKAAPPDYNTSTKINYGTSQWNGDKIEAENYAAYLDTVNVYQRSRERKITSDYEDCYAAATNATQSKKCATDSTSASTALRLELSKIRRNSLVEYVSRKDQIKKYWASKSGN